MKSKVRRATGCITCRQRKVQVQRYHALGPETAYPDLFHLPQVKCDETPEKCNNCENMGLQCTYISNDSGTQHSKDGSNISAQ
jgi:hypothetical protein